MKSAKWLAIVASILLSAGLALGQTGGAKDSDSDGIPDEVEQRLGTDPNTPEKFEVVWESTKPPAADTSRDIRKILLGNVAGNRYLWVLEFAADFELKNTNLTVYVDADNNPKRGMKSKDYIGTDFVMWLSDGGRCCHGYSIPGEGAAPAPTRFAWIGKRVYFCTDMPLAQEDGRTRCRAFARCEVLEPRVEVSSTGWVTVNGPGETERAKPAIVAVEPEAAGSVDSDGDGISDAVEGRLGTDPKTPEQVNVIFDYTKASDAARRKQKLAASPERCIEKISFGNVAGDRYLWCVEFGANYPTANSNFILYLDADNDAKTGRKDMPGVDYMLGVSDGGAGISAISPTGEYSSGPALRTFLSGKRLYLCADLPLKQEGGESVYRATALSEQRKPAWSDTTGWFPVKGAGISDRKKAFGLDDVVASENMEMTRGLDIFRALKADPANAVVKIGNCEFQGFEDDMRAEYKESSAIRTVPGGKIFATVPKDGRFHFGLLLYDQAGTERLEVRYGGKRLGVAVADEDDNRTKLFFTKEAYDFKAGARVELRTAQSSGSYRVEDLIFLAKPPEVRPRVLELSDLEVTPVWEGDAARPGVARVTWITTWPAKCTVKYAEAGAPEREITEPQEFANHRVYLDGLKVGATYQMRVIAPKPKGGEVTSAPITFSTALPVVKAATERGTVPLKVENPSADGLTAWPVTSGIPFPKGALDSVAHIRLLGPDGAERPVQAQSLARWPDGSVKWALVSLRADAPAQGSADYTLEYGAKVKPSDVKTGLSVEEQAEAVTITTGPMKMEISKSAFALPGKVWLDKNGDGKLTDDEVVCGGKGGGTLVDNAGKEFTTLGPAEEITVEERGPERACVLVKGHHVAKDGTKLFAYEARIMAYAGQKFVRLFYTFGNDALKTDFTSVRSLHLVFPVLEGAARFEMGGEAAPPLKDMPAGPAIATQQGEASKTTALFQDSDEHYSFASGMAKVEGKRAAGWVRVTGPKGTMTIAVRDFWRLYPKALAVDGDGIKVGLMPPLTEDQYAEQAKDPAKLVHYYYNLMGGLYKIKQGQTKTHEMMISFENDGKKAGLDAFQEGVMATAPSAWVCGSLALGEIAPTGTAWSAKYDAQMDKGVVNYIKSRDSRHDYGMMNYGDWWGERGYNWGNIEYDDAHVWMVQFARTGDMRSFMLGDRAAKHYGDVDCIHYCADPKRLGAGYSHCLGHVGGFFKTNPVEGGSLGGGHSPCHTRTEGLVEHYLMTGDRRSFDAALGIAEHFDSWWLNNYDMSNCRVPGWHIVLTTSLYNATADPFYLNAAKIIARRAIERAHPDGGWRRCMVPGHCYDLPRHRGEAGFMLGVLLAGMKYYHEATGDPRAADVLVKAARWLVRETYDPATNQFRYTSCPNSSKPSSTPNMACEGFAYAARLTGAPDLVKLTRDVVKDLVAKAGGSSASAIRFIPRALWDLDRLGASQYGLVSPKEVEVLALNNEGEDFTVTADSRDAKVEVVSPSGKRATCSVEGNGSSVKANKEQGIYRIRVKGATGVTTSLDAEALAIGNGVCIKSDGLLKLQFSSPPAGVAGEKAVLFKAQAKGEYVARLTGSDGEEAATLTWHDSSTWMAVKMPKMAGGECMVELRGPAGDVEVRLEGLPPYISAPSGKFFCPARPRAAFAVTNGLLPGGKAEVVLDASRSTDLDGDITEYVWKFSDGTEAKGQRVTKDLRVTPMEFQATLAVRDKLGFSDSCTQTVAAAPAWLLALDPKAVALVEAEDFCGQGLGEVRLYERGGCSGRMITYWHEVIGHWLEWKVNVPKTGEYAIILKYATQCDETLRDLKINGAYPGEAFTKFHLPNTGGFCATKNDWAYYTIGGEKTPAMVCLAAGTHTLRMSNLKDGCALDFILLAPR